MLYFLGADYIFFCPKTFSEIELDAKTLRHAGAIYAKQEIARGDESVFKMAFMRKRGARNVPHISLGIYGKEIQIAVGQNNRKLDRNEYTALQAFAEANFLTIKLQGYCRPNFLNEVAPTKADVCQAINDFAANLEKPKTVAVIAEVAKPRPIHEVVDLQAHLKVVITRINGLFKDSADIDRTLTMLNNAGKTLLGLTRKIRGNGQILGNVMILDVKIPLDSATNAQNETAFNNAVKDNLIAKFGAINVGYVTPKAVRTVTVTIQTEKTEVQLRKQLAELGLKVA